MALLVIPPLEKRDKLDAIFGGRLDTSATFGDPLGHLVALAALAVFATLALARAVVVRSPPNGCLGIRALELLDRLNPGLRVVTALRAVPAVRLVPALRPVPAFRIGPIFLAAPIAPGVVIIIF